MSSHTTHVTVYFPCGSDDGTGILVDSLGTEFPAPLDMAAVERRAMEVAQEAVDASNGEGYWSNWLVGAYWEDEEGDRHEVGTWPFPARHD